MPFIDSGISDGDQQSVQGPVQPPAGTAAADAVKHGDAEHRELRDMCQFTNAHVHQIKRAMRSQGKEPSKDGDYDAAGLLTAEEMRREDRNKNGHEDCRKPVLQPGVQAPSLRHEAASSIKRNASAGLGDKSCSIFSGGVRASA